MTSGHYLADTRFYLHGESVNVTKALSRYVTARGAQVTELQRLDDLKIDESECVLVVHYAEGRGLPVKLPRIKKDNAALRVLLLHEFTDRGKIEAPVLSATDHILEKPFSAASLEKALHAFRFHPLTGKSVFVYEGKEAAALLRTLGATLFEKLPGGTPLLPLELAVFAPTTLDDGFREFLAQFRAQYPDVPVFMLYDPQAPGVLDSTVLNEIAYLIQTPVARQALREKILAFFDQPQRDRRKNPRKKGISQIWVSAFNNELGAAEIFESPYLIDISQSGLSFQSYMEYAEDTAMVIWVIAEDYPDKIIDLRGQIRWQRRETADANARTPIKYGVEFVRENSVGYSTFARMIAMH